MQVLSVSLSFKGRIAFPGLNNTNIFRSIFIVVKMGKKS